MPKAKYHKLLSTKKFLNNRFHHSDATIFASVEVRDYKTAEYGVSIYNNLKIRDCSQIVNLALDMESRVGFTNSIRKVNTLVEELTKLRVAMQKAWVLKGQLETKNKKNAAKQTGKKVQKVPSSTEGR